MAGERKKKSPRKVEQNDRGTEEENLPEADVIAGMLDRGSRTGVGGWSAEMMEAMVGMDDEQTERMFRMFRSNFTEEMGGDPEMVIEGIRKFVQERRQGKEEVQREEEAGEEERKQEKEARTGRGNAGGEDERFRRNEASGKGKGKGHEGKGEHEKEGGRGGTGARQKMPSEEDEEDERAVVAPDTGAVGSHPRAMTDPEEEEGRKQKGEKAEEQQCRGGKRSQAGEWTLRPAREWQKWADCVDVESEEERGEEVEQEAEDECEGRKIEEQRRGSEEAGSRSGE